MTVPSAKELLAALFETIDTCRWDRLGDVLADDCVCEPSGVAEPLAGLARIERFYRHERPIASGRHQIEEVVVGGDAAACWGRFTGENTSGQPVDIRFADTFAIRAGKIVRRTSYLRGPGS